MLKKLENQRWLIAMAAFVIQLCLGTVYAWSVFKNDLVANHGWEEVATSTTFMICIGMIGLAAAFGGILVDKKGPKFVAIIGGLLFGLGTILAGFGVQIHNILLLYLGYGVIGGLGNGFGYVTPIATLIRWFPDKRGLVTGLAVMGFGAGAFFMGKIAPTNIAFFGVANTFYIWGVIFLILVISSALLFENPPKGWLPAGFNTKSKTAISDTESFDLGEAVRSPQWWILWAMLLLNITAGIGLISQLSPIGKELYRPLVNSNLSEKQILLAIDAAGGLVVAIASIFNGLGRLFWAWLSDGFGRKTIFSAIFLSQAVLYMMVPHINNYYVFMVVACYLLACYGGGFATMPAFVADAFGAKNIGRIYGTMLTAWGVAGVTGPFVFAYVKQLTGSFLAALYIAAGLLMIGFILTRVYKRPIPPQYMRISEHSLNTGHDLMKLLLDTGLLSQKQVELIQEYQKEHSQTYLRFEEVAVLWGLIKQETADFFVKELPELMRKSEHHELDYYLKKSCLLNEKQIEIIEEQKQQTGLDFGELAIKDHWVKPETINWFLTCPSL